MSVISFMAALSLASIHVFAGKLDFLSAKSRNVWLSASGGLSVAFVILYLLPELAARQTTLEQSVAEASLTFLEHHVYLLTLAGIVTFYGLERLAKRSRQHGNPPAGRSQERVFWSHLASFAAYNLAIGYLISHEAGSLGNLALFSIAMALHFLVIDFSFRDHYQNVYHDKGRWILAGAIVAGWAISLGVEIPESLMSVIIAFLAGGIILNALKEELPEEKQSRFWPFLLGAVFYAVIMVVHAGWGS